MNLDTSGGARTGGQMATRGDSEGLWDWNLDSNRIHFSPRWLALVGCDDHEVGTTPDDWFRRVHPDDSASLLRELEIARDGDSTAFACRYRLRHKNGTYRWMSCRGTVGRDSAGRAIRLSGSQADITVEIVTDPLTRLPNRLLLIDRVAESIERARRYNAFHFAVLLIDLGRSMGLEQPAPKAIDDPLLIAVARRLETCLRIPDTMPSMRNNDLVARVDGDRFAILLDGLEDITHATVAADRILGQILDPFALGGREVRLSASIGVAVSATGYTKADEMLHDAETALHRAQILGGSHCEFFDTAILKSEQTELQIEGDFDAALQRREFEVFYQPIVSLTSNEVLGFEALVRWRHPVLGMIAPADFIPIAERTGFILPLGNWILREACRRLSEWQTGLPLSRDLSVSVNISGVQWNDAGFVDQVAEALRDAGLEPRRLVLELTEGIAMANPAAVTTLLMRLRAMGVRISIDDFGTGFSSLAYLRQFPIDTLKIDRSFVRGLVTNKDTAEIVVGLMVMAQQLGLQVVAEGIEHEDQCAHLRALKCEAGQGYLFAKPLDADTASQVLKGGLAPRPERQATARPAGGRRVAKLWGVGTRFVANHRVSFALAALALLSSVWLVVALDTVPPAVRESVPRAHDVKQNVAVAASAPPAVAQPVPMSTTGPVVERTPSAPIAPVTMLKEPPKVKNSAPLPSAPATPPSTRISPAPLSAAPIALPQTTSLDVIHLHRLGNCRGRLEVSRDGVAFVSEENDSDAFTLKYTEFLHALSDDTLTLKSANKTYRFRTGRATSDSAVQLRDVADTIARSRQ